MTEDAEASRWPLVAIVLSRDVRFVEIPEIDVPTIVVDGVSFENVRYRVDPDYWTGFYDWVVEQGEITAFRYIPWDETVLGELVQRRSYATQENGMYEIRLPRTIPAGGMRNLSQLFGENAVFRSSAGDFAITMRLEESGLLALLDKV